MTRTIDRLLCIIGAREFAFRGSVEAKVDAGLVSLICVMAVVLPPHEDHQIALA